MSKEHLGMGYWRGDDNCMVISYENGDEVIKLPGERGDLGARLWIEGFRFGQAVGRATGRAEKAAEIRAALREGEDA